MVKRRQGQSRDDTDAGLLASPPSSVKMILALLALILVLEQEHIWSFLDDFKSIASSSPPREALSVLSVTPIVTASGNQSSLRSQPQILVDDASPTPEKEKEEEAPAIEEERPAHYKPAHFYCLCATRKDAQCNQDFCDTILTYNDPTNWNASTIISYDNYNSTSSGTQPSQPHHHTRTIQMNLNLNMPGSTWTTARNTMYQLANRRRRIAKLQGVAPESHYCFMDGDTTVSKATKADVIAQLFNETERNKIIAFNYRRAYNGVEYAFAMDANLNCFAEQSMDLYLPYSPMKDHQAWYLAQTDLHFRANLIEPFVFKVYNEIIIRNPAHNNAYPRDGEVGSNELFQMQLDEGFSLGCWPSAEARQLQTIHNCTFQDKENNDDEPLLLYSMSFNATHRFA